LETMADHALSAERQRLIALIANAPRNKLKKLVSAVEAALPDLSGGRASTNSSSPQRSNLRGMAARRHFDSISQPFGQRGGKNGKLKLPKLPAGLSWTTKKYSIEHRRYGVTIEEFLRDEWLPLISAGYGELRWLRLVDPSAVNALNYLKRTGAAAKKRRL